VTTNTRFAADTRKLAYAQAFSRTSTLHAAARPERTAAAPGSAERTPLRALTSRLHRARRSAR
jgi:hypothetical protein